MERGMYRTVYCSFHHYINHLPIRRSYFRFRIGAEFWDDESQFSSPHVINQVSLNDRVSISSGIWRRVVCWVSTDVSEEHVASIFRVEEISSAKTSKQAEYSAGRKADIYIYRKQKESRRLELRSHWLVLHGVTSQKMILFITTAVRTSNLHILCLFYNTQ
jgi:hypothetical protein